MPKALKTCPKSNKSPNLVTLDTRQFVNKPKDGWIQTVEGKSILQLCCIANVISKNFVPLQLGFWFFLISMENLFLLFFRLRFQLRLSTFNNYFNWRPRNQVNYLPNCPYLLFGKGMLKRYDRRLFWHCCRYFFNLCNF